MLILIKNMTIYTGQSIFTNKQILIQNGKVYSIQQNDADIKYIKDHNNIQIIDLGGDNIGPGFIDIQINGGKKFYFSESPTQNALQDIYQACCQYGTPFILPTIISSPLSVIFQAIQNVRTFKQTHPGVLGMHLQGPFFNIKKKGAHNQKMIRKPTNQQLNQIIQKGKDVIKIITIAPECFTDEQLDMLIKSGIVVSLGHCDLTYEQTQKYFNKGIKLVTHLYNAMTQMGQRQCGTVGAVFDNEEVYASIILDGGHCHYAAARIAYKLKKDKLVLVTDSSFLGRQQKQFTWDGWNIQMKQGYFRDKNGNLAGAAISMPEAIRNAKNNLGITLQESIQMATSRVAKSIKLQKQIGFIKEGYPAKFVVFNNDLTKIKTLIF